MNKNAEQIMTAMLKDAEQEMLHIEKWTKYGCSSEKDARDYIEGLLAAKSICALPTRSIDLHIRNGKTLTFSQSTPYAITATGKDDLKRLLAESATS